MSDWQPDASLELLRARARLLAQTREFFARRKVLEVETPVLSQASVTDIHIQSLYTTQVLGAHDMRQYFLQTSPEYAMKRLLAAGSGAIYQIARVFRQGEAGQRHNPEFSLLEWYRPAYKLKDLMQETAEYCQLVLGRLDSEFYSYRQIFLLHLGFDPGFISDQDLIAFGQSQIKVQGDLQRQQWLDLLMSECIEPKLKKPGVLSFIFDYPACQAALARIDKDQDGVPVAKRFEVFYQGLELANGYDELLEADEQRQRFEEDARQRQSSGLAAVPIDEHLLAALQAGMPACCGVALGLDRLLMLQQQRSRISEVLAFAIHKA